MTEEPKGSQSHAGASYLSYLLRMWSMSRDGGAGKWLASVESPLTGERRQFADLESLFAFLRTMTGQPASGDAESRNSGTNLTATELKTDD